MSPVDSDEVTVTQVLPLVEDLGADATPDEQAMALGLSCVSDDEPGLRRVRRGRGFSYHDPDGSLVEGAERERLAALAVPPAWTDVWICPDPRGHLLATGRDAAGRKQHLYHPVWRRLREAAKFHRLNDVGGALPAVREAVDAHLRKRTLSREKVLALVVALLDKTLIRVGNARYADENGSYGLTTLEPDHVDVSGSSIQFAFPGKSGKELEVDLRDGRLARQLLRVEDTPGQRLFAYRDPEGDWCEVDSGAVNAYLREVAGTRITAKDFRTWGATTVAAQHLRELGAAEDPRELDVNVLEAIDAVAARLGNTRAVARASYVHPLVPKAYRLGRLLDNWDDDPDERDRLTAAERAVTRVLRLDLPSSTAPGGTDGSGGRP